MENIILIQFVTKPVLDKSGGLVAIATKIIV